MVPRRPVDVCGKPRAQQRFARRLGFGQRAEVCDVRRQHLSEQLLFAVKRRVDAAGAQSHGPAEPTHRGALVPVDPKNLQGTTDHVVALELWSTRHKILIPPDLFKISVL